MVATTRPSPRSAPRTSVALVEQAQARRTTVALKLLMAGSGSVFVLWVLAHMYGNLKAFQGHDAFDAYAEHLRTLGTPILPHGGFLWISRAVLILLLVIHVTTAVLLWRRADTARSHQYAVRRYKHSTFSSRFMRWGGLTILVFLVWHLLNFNFGKINVRGGAVNDPYNLLVDTFSVWWSTVIYLLAMVALGLHLRHGVWSASQTLGWTSTARARRNAKAVGLVAAVVIAGGFSLVPIFVAVGVISK